MLHQQNCLAAWIARFFVPVILLVLPGCGGVAMYTAGFLVSITGEPGERALYTTSNLTVSGPQAARARVESVEVTPKVLWDETGDRLSLKSGSTFQYKTQVLALDGLHVVTLVDGLSERGLSCETVVRNGTDHPIRIPIAAIRWKYFPASQYPKSGPSFDAVPFLPVESACHTIVITPKPKWNGEPASLGKALNKDEGRVWVPSGVEAVLVQPGEALLLRTLLSAPPAQPSEKTTRHAKEDTSGMFECTLENTASGEILQCRFEFEFATIAKLAPVFY